MAESDILRELHDAYVWKVNAAVAEDRLDLVWEFADEYTDEALRVMSTQRWEGCGRPGCVICEGDTSRRTVPPRRPRLWRPHPHAR